MLQIPEPRWTADGGLNYAAERLVIDHLPLARARARKFFLKRADGCGGSVDDLEGEAMLGLMAAIKHFDPAKGSFGNYAVWWIDAALREFTTRNRSIVKLPRPALNNAPIHAPGQPRPSLPALRFARKYKSTPADTSLDTFEGDALDRVIGTTDNPETAGADHQQSEQRSAMLGAAIGTLNPRECAIITARHGDEEPATLGDLASRFGISAERVRQIEKRAIEKMRGAVAGTVSAPAHSAPLCGRYPGLAPSKDRTDNILRHAVLGRFTLRTTQKTKRDSAVARPVTFAIPSWAIGRHFDHIIAFRRHAATAAGGAPQPQPNNYLDAIGTSLEQVGQPIPGASVPVRPARSRRVQQSPQKPWTPGARTMAEYAAAGFTLAANAAAPISKAAPR